MREVKGIKRRKAGLELLVIFVCVLAGSLFSSTVVFSRDINKELSELKTFVETLGQSLSQAETLEVETYILTMAATEWPQELFVRDKALVEYFTDTKEAGDQIKAAAVPEGSLIYSGYLETGDTKLAIIDGFEYEVGETLEVGGYIVRGISPDQVVIAPIGGEGKIVLPLKETK